MGERVETVCVGSPFLFLLMRVLLLFIIFVRLFLLLFLHHWSGALPRPLMAQHQVHQVLLLPAGVGGDVAQQQVLAQVLHSELHEARTLEGCSAEQVAGRAAAQVLLQHRAQGAEALLTITADVLRREKQISYSFSCQSNSQTSSLRCFPSNITHIYKVVTK